MGVGECLGVSFSIQERFVVSQEVGGKAPRRDKNPKRQAAQSTK